MNIKEWMISRGVRVPDPIEKCDGAFRIYRVELTSDGIYEAALALHAAGCKPRADIPTGRPTTVELVEHTRAERWIMKFYARNEDHANTILEDVATALADVDERQMEFDF